MSSEKLRKIYGKEGMDTLITLPLNGESANRKDTFTDKQTDVTSVNVYWNATISLEQSFDVSQIVGLVIYIYIYIAVLYSL